MSSTDTSTEIPEVGTVDMKLEVVRLQVSDVDRAKTSTARAVRELLRARGLSALPSGGGGVAAGLCASREPDQPAVVRVLVDHVDLRRRAQDLIACSEPDVAELHELGARLEGHIRHEERVLFPLIEEVLPLEELERLAVALGAPTPPAGDAPSHLHVTASTASARPARPSARSVISVPPFAPTTRSRLPAP